MSDYTNTPIGSGYNANSAINTELSAVETAVNSKLDKSGSTMTGELDMNSKKIINLPDATTLQEPVTYGQMINGASFAASDAKYFATVALATADTTLAVGDVVIIEERANGIFNVISGTGTANTYDIIAHGSLSLSLELRIKDYPKLSQLGATGLITFDATAVFQRALVLAEVYGAVWVDVGYHKIQSALTATRSITILGPNKGGNGYNTITAPNRSVILKDFDGDLITFDGSSATATGTGGGIDGVDLVQYLGSSASSNPSFSGGAGAAIKVTGTTTNLRAGRLKIDNCSVERWDDGGDSGNDWTYGLDVDGSTVGGSDGVRNNWLMNTRIVCGTDTTAGVRIYNAFNTWFSNIALDDRDGSNNNTFLITGPDAPGQSSNVFFSSCSGNLTTDFASNVKWTGGRVDATSTTANSSEVQVMPASLNTLPTASAGLVSHFGRGDRMVTQSAQAITHRFGQDAGYADTTDITGIEVGNINDNEGALGLLYRNGASQEVILRANLRNNADSANANMAEHKMVKNAGVDTADHEFTIGGSKVAEFDNTSTAGSTRFLIYDVDNATVERVTVGAADSGGAGFKVLRIPN